MSSDASERTAGGAPDRGGTVDEGGARRMLEDAVPVAQLAVLGLIALIAALGAVELSWPLVVVLALFLAVPHVPDVVDRLVDARGASREHRRDLRRAIDDAADAVDALPGDEPADGEEAELAGQLLDYLREDRVIALALVRHRITARLAALAEQHGGAVETLDDPHATAERLRVEGLVADDVADAASRVVAALDRALERPEELGRSQTARLLDLAIRSMVHLGALRGGTDGLLRRAGTAGTEEEDGDDEDSEDDDGDDDRDESTGDRDGGEAGNESDEDGDA